MNSIVQTESAPVKLSELSQRAQKSIHEATNHVKTLKDNYYDGMDLRCKCIYKLAESNLHKCCGRKREAIQSAEDAKRLISKWRGYMYKIEKKQVNEALRLLGIPI